MIDDRDALLLCDFLQNRFRGWISFWVVINEPMFFCRKNNFAGIYLLTAENEG